jgi:uncharacterized phiE125 gp8 family phage protein
MPEILIQPPRGEPIDLVEAQLHLRITEDSQNPILRGLIASARIAAETKTRQQLLHARWKLVLDKFPMAGVGTPLPFRDQVNIPPYAIVSPHAPLVDIVSITYLDMNGVLQTVAPTVYVVNSTMMPAIVSPVFGQIWPIPLPQIGAVQITYDAGYASQLQFPTAPTPAAPASGFQVIGPVVFAVGAMVRFYNSGGALPAAVDGGQDFLIASVTPGAIANYNTYTVTDPVGAAISFVDGGAGSNYIASSARGVVPEGIRSWILLRIGSIYENREEVAILNRGKVEELPFVDGLLDPYRLSLP